MDCPRSRALNNIPQKKLQDTLKAIESGSDGLQDKSIRRLAVLGYAESNIPIEYWSLKMDRDFHGDPRLLEKFSEYTKDIKASYIGGVSICFAGLHGVGKTLTTTCILKEASKKGYACLYTTLSDIVSALIHGSGEDKFLARRELLSVDFLVIDEWDGRFFGSENAADLYARSLEGIFRTRSSNKQPTLLCTNSPNVIESFHGPLKASIESLMNGYLEVFVVMGTDYRKKSK